MAKPTPRTILKTAKARAFLVTNPVNIRYLTGANVSTGAVLIEKNIELFVDSRYTERALSQAIKSINIRPIEMLTDRLTKLRQCAFEGEFVTAVVLSKWKKKFKNTKFVQSEWLLEEFRRQKEPNELQNIRKACAITKKILNAVPMLLKKGHTEKSLAFELERLARKLGADGMAFDSIVAFGEHTSRPHHEPTDRRIRSSDIVQIDTGVKCNGYCSDYSRVYFMSPPTSEQSKALRALKEAKKEAEAAIEIGVSNHELDCIARDALKHRGFEKEFSHSLGHGVGLEIHEGINLSQKAPKKKLVKHEVITIEPGLYFSGKWGMRLEDTIIVS